VPCKLSILICTLEERREQFETLYNNLLEQVEGKSVEVLYERDNREMTVGEKRNKLMNRAKGEYLCYVDDDDEVSYDYIEQILIAIITKPDCVGINGVIYGFGVPKRFIHSIKYKAYTDGMEYHRPPNHLNPIRSDLAKTYTFKKLNFSEDTDYAMHFVKNRILNSEVMIEENIYFYNYNVQKSATSGN